MEHWARLCMLSIILVNKVMVYQSHYSPSIMIKGGCTGTLVPTHICVGSSSILGTSTLNSVPVPNENNLPGTGAEIF